ncbi:uncharacterized protein LOC110809585 [Carica papaya]|uniref:uncharacterized protein LOC110809585 n=1 Tax=Carica papaya TaxID=3649 RepID=UPI000B8CD64A|nr:uncharacterized protein LOC110809585 [Carica papaya]
MNTSAISAATTTNCPQSQLKSEKPQKPPFRPAKDDTKPVLQDPILRSDPIETEEAVLRLPPFPILRSSK